MKVSHVVPLILLMLWGSQDSCVVQSRLLSISTKPDPKDAAATARWLVSFNFWGVLKDSYCGGLLENIAEGHIITNIHAGEFTFTTYNTISIDLDGAPFGDGLPNEGTGIPYFYLTTLDPTARNALKDERASFSVSEYPLGTCGKVDPENPTCSKISLTGKLKLVDEKSKEGEFVRNALFSKHSEMKDWPSDHDFQVFKLEIENIFLIDWFGGPKPLTVEEYLHPKVNNHGFIL